LTSRSTMINLRIFQDRNFVIGVFFSFFMGFLLIPTAAILPTMMQELMGYPTITSGLVVGSRGIGTMAAMVVASRIARKVDIRLLVMLAFICQGVSLAQMTAFSPEMDWWPIVTSGLLQGIGMGLGFSSLTIVCFSSLRPELRTDGSAIYNLVRTLGSSIGISIIVTLLSHGIQHNHAELVERLNMTGIALDPTMSEKIMSAGGGSVLAMVEMEITRQASMIAYLNDFHFMMLVTFALVPFTLLIRRIDHYEEMPAAE